MKPNRVTVIEIISDMGAILNNINVVLKDHEERLQLIEELDLKTELELLRCRILGISDLKKQAKALVAFKKLCEQLGFADLDSLKS